MSSPSEQMMFDAVVVGGGAADLGAALVLGRSCRRVLVLDVGEPRNAGAAAVHNFLSRDGTPPLELLREARAQLAPYDTVEIRAARVHDAGRLAGEAGPAFAVTLEGGERVNARRLLLASGTRDELPPIPGLGELWGRAAYGCPYCHGFEVRDEPLAVLASGEEGLAYARKLTGWSRNLVVLTNGPAGFGEAGRSELAALGIPLYEAPVLRLTGTGDHLEQIHLEGGAVLERRALFVGAPRRPRSELAARLGCDLDAQGQVRVDEVGRTSVPGVFAAGDLTPKSGAVVLCAAGGMLAAVTLNEELIAADLERRLAHPRTDPARAAQEAPVS